MICDKEKLAFEHTSDCPVGMAEEVLDAVRRESCGKCVLCREGTRQVYEIVKDITLGNSESGDLELLAELLGVIKAYSGCEMAATAAAAVSRSLEADANEWDSHTRRKRCTALWCSGLYTLHAAPDKCDGCGECVKVCGKSAIVGGDGMIHVIDNDKCDRCLECVKVCGPEAIVKAGGVKPKGPAEPVPVGSWGQESTGRRRRRG